MFLFLSMSTVFSQLDTLSLFKKIATNYAQVNGYFELITNKGTDEPNAFYKKKVWFVKDKQLKNITSLRLENYYKNSKQAESIIILNEKQKYYINPINKRSDLCFFNLLKEEELENFYLKAEQECLPTFMRQDGQADETTNDVLTELRAHDNLYFEILKDTAINGVNCFAYKLTDFDKNNGYIADITGKGNEKYAERKIETYYLNKVDTTIVLKVVKYEYANPYIEKLTYELINAQLFNDKKNTSIHLYTIKTDTLRNYFQTKTRFNGTAFEPCFSEFNAKKATPFTGLTIDNTPFNLEQIKSKYILIGFWTTDCFDCLLQLNAINKQYEELKALGLTFIAVNSSERMDAAMKEFLTEKNYSFPTVFSIQAGDLYQANKTIMYLLLDKDFYFKEVYQEMNDEIGRAHV